jgi:Ca2+-binding RTX toxin-like protein
MTDITGTNNPETLTGTGDADTITALGGNDTVNAGGGNDTIFGGLGNDTLNGEDGDDTFVENEFTSPTEVFNGGSGIDTVELRVAPAPLLTAFGSLTPHTLSSATSLVSIERLVFASTAGQVVQASVSYDYLTATPFQQIVGGAGRDFLTVSLGTATGTFTMPTLALSGWDALPTNAWEHTGDIVVLSSGATGSVTLNALAGANFFQIIAGGAGNDILNGSGNADSIDASRGGDAVNAGGGNDSIVITNTMAANGVSWIAATTFSGAGGTWDGGAGTDVVTIGGIVNLQATLVGIEGFALLPAFNPTLPIVARQEAAVLILDSAHLAMIPTNAFFTGVGTVVFSLADNASFNLSTFVITPGSDISFAVFAGDGNGLTFNGGLGDDTITLGAGTQTANGGGGNDFIQFGIGTQSATGGAGADSFRIGMINGTVTDFTLGEDKVDFSGTDIFNTGRLFDLISQGGNGAVIGATTIDGTFQMTLQGISMASLTASDFVLGIGDGGMDNETGTAAAEYFFGQQNNDIYHGGGGNDRFYGGGGADQIFGEDGDDTIVLDGALNFGGTYDGGTGTDTLLVRPSVGSPPGGPPTQYIVFPGAPGTGMVSIERLQFDSSTDFALTFVTTTVPSFTEVIGGAGADAVVFVAVSAGTYSMPSFTLTNWTAGVDAVVLAAQVGTNFAVTFNGRNDISNVLVGQLGADTLNGGALNDILLGGGNNDTLNGNGGADLLFGEAGNDRLNANATSGSAQFDGGLDSDTLVVSGAANVGTIGGMEAIELTAGAALTLTGTQFANGFAAASTASGSGTITVNMAADLAFVSKFWTIGSGVSFIVNGTSGSDAFKLGNGAHTINAGDGVDQIKGGNLVDTINGDAGNDKINGAGGADILTGGAGSDVFKYANASDSGLGAAGDRITDFTIGQDRLNFSLLDADAGTAGDQAFSLVGTAAFSNTGIGQIRYQDSGADLLVQLDVDGNGTADMEVLLQGLAGQTLTGANFVL